MGLVDWFRRGADGGGDQERPGSSPPAGADHAPLPPVTCPCSTVGATFPADRLELFEQQFRPVVPPPMTAGSRPAADCRLWLGRGDGALLRRAAESYPVTGLWPVVVDRPPDDPTAAIDGRWLHDVLEPPHSPVAAGADLAAIDLLAGWWDANRSVGTPDTSGAPERDEMWFRDFPGLARLSVDGPVASAEWQDRRGDEVVGLVAAARPADVPAALGWWGAVNHDQSGAQLSAVLRTWEDRFGAVLVAIGFDSMVVVPARAPADRDEALRLAAEHLAFCSDNVFQGLGSVPAYADWIVEQSEWTFWWD